MHWSQIQTILWLRWRLTRNQWARGGRLSVAVSFIVMALLLVIGVGGGIAGLLVGVLGLKVAAPPVLLAVYDFMTIVFLLFWCIGSLSTIQRSESIDVSKLLHLPVSLKGVFLVNYLASHVTLSIVVFLPAMLGLAAGLALGGRGMMLLLVPLVLAFLFAITAWTYCLRGWLVILMQNPRRYRAVVAVVTMTFVLLCQLPNLLNLKSFHKPRSVNRTGAQVQTGPVEQGRESSLPPGILLAHKLAPPLWVGNGAMSLAAGNPVPAVLAAVASFGIGGLGLARAYRSTLRFYEGRTTEKKARPVRKESQAQPARSNLLERRLPWIGEDAAAMMLASLQSLRRAIEVKMALAYNAVMILVFAGTAMLSHSRNLSFRMQLFYATGIALLPFLGMTYLMTNQFGFDRAGFRTLVLSPMPRSQILLGKNLALLPVGMVLGLVYLTLAALGLGLGAVVVLAAVVQLLKMSLTPLRRGYIHFDSITFARPDPFGLFNALYTYPLTDSLLVLPKRYPVKPIFLSGSRRYQRGGVQLALSVGDSEEFVSLRDYRPGDALRHIHWKSLAKLGKPIIKEFQDEFFVRHALILDTFIEEHTSQRFEAAVSVAASLVSSPRSQEVLLDLMFVGTQAYCFTGGRGLAQTENLLEVLACVEACTQPFEHLYPLIKAHSAGLSGAICVLLDWDEARQQLVRLLRNNGVALLVFVVSSTGLDLTDEHDDVHVLQLDQLAEGLTQL